MSRIYLDDIETPGKIAHQLLRQLESDRRCHLDRIRKYMDGHHDLPYLPPSANFEYKELARRSITNWLPLVISTAAQTLYVDGFRTSDAGKPKAGDNPLWVAFQESNCDGLQNSLYRGALTYGQAWVVAELEDGSPVLRVVPPSRGTGLFYDPLDVVPGAFIEVTHEPRQVGKNERPGVAVMYIGDKQYEVTFKTYTDEKTLTVVETGVSMPNIEECPVVRFATRLDVEGRVSGFIAELLTIQDRINQAVFDATVVQSQGAFTARWATGMAPPVKMETTTMPNGEVRQTPAKDDNGQMIPLDQPIAPGAVAWAPKADVKFGTFQATDMRGYHNHIEVAITHFSALAQLPAHFILGQIANLSAEALMAANETFSLKMKECKNNYGESWEKILRIAVGLTGNKKLLNDERVETVWRETNERSLSATADGLFKMKQGLEMPTLAGWAEIPGMTETKMAEWQALREEEQEQAKIDMLEQQMLGEQLDGPEQAGAAGNGGGTPGQPGGTAVKPPGSTGSKGRPPFSAGGL